MFIRAASPGYVGSRSAQLANGRRGPRARRRRAERAEGSVVDIVNAVARAGDALVDAAYIALAEALDCPLLTRDARLARSSGHVAQIKVR